MAHIRNPVSLGNSTGSQGRRGAIVIVAAVSLLLVMAFLAFAVDWGYITVAHSDLQNAADAAALSGARALPEGRDEAIAAAQLWASKNLVAGDAVTTVASEDVEIGTWDEDTTVFTALPSNSSTSGNAVRVTCRRLTARGNPLDLFFAPILGTDHAELSATATATLPGGGFGTRFLIDSEMIDTGLPAIQSLANSLGRSVDALLRARGFNRGLRYGSTAWTWADNFLDLPAGATISLPTGQGTSYSNNDAGMFDITHASFPFTSDASFMQFLMYSETGGDTSKWGTDASTIRNQLDPLQGVAPVTNAAAYQSFVDPDFIHVSPVFYSDVSTLNMQSGVPRVNAKGLRRGLLAFSIIAVGIDVDGSGSVLPKLVLKIADPNQIDPAVVKRTTPGSSGGTGRVTLVE